MFIVASDGTSAASSIANYLVSRGHKVLTVGAVPRVDTVDVTTLEHWRRVDFTSPPEVLSVVSDLAEELRPKTDLDKVAGFVFVPHRPPKVSVDILDQFILQKQFQSSVFGPLMLYRYLQQFDCLANTGCRTLFVQPFAQVRLDPDRLAFVLACDLYRKLMDRLHDEFQFSRGQDVFSVVQCLAEDDDYLTKEVERYLTCKDPSTTYPVLWSVG